jgi:hypothetical protein
MLNPAARNDLVLRSLTPWVAAVVLVVAAWALGMSAPSLAAKDNKPTRLVTGIVSDEADNPIAGATVMLTDLQTGKKSASYTSGEGKYQFSGLEFTRDYEVQATHKGLSSKVRRVSTIDPRTSITFNLRIPPPKDEE